jgi:hypothetical protein
MKTIILASLVASAAAMATKKVSNNKVQAAPVAATVSPYEQELGVIAPTGFFDPFRLSSKIDQEKFDTYRLAELKHGRVAQLAILGYLVQEISRFPGQLAFGLNFADVPNGVDAINVVPAIGWAQILLAVGLVETKGTLGDFAQGQLNLPDDILQKRLLAELQHGRIAMLGFAELIRHDVFDGPGEKLLQGLPFLYPN